MVRVWFAGTPEAAVPALRALAATPHPIVQVLSQPARPRGRRGAPVPSPVHAAATALGLPVATPARCDATALAALPPADLGVVVAYGHVLPRAWLEAPRLGWLNLHFSLLPRWRGAAPVAAALRAGDAETGVSVIRLVAALDAGPVLAVRRTPIGPDETRGALEARLAALGAPLLVEVVAALAAGTAVATPQAAEGVTVAPTLAKDAGRVDFGADAAAIARHVRAMHPWPGAFAELRLAARPAPVRVVLLAVAEVPTPAAGAAAGPPPAPGTVLDAAAGLVAAGRGAVRVARLQPAGGTPVEWRAFVNGYRVAAGDRFALPPG
jgi:methionyl-tRNA formyltransferase